MSTPPRRLTFAVGTSLLTASLSLGIAGCDEQTTNPGPDKAEKQQPKPDDPTVNQVAPPQPEPVPSSDEGIDPEQVEPPHVNEGPEPDPTPPEKAPEPKRVNTRPTGPS